jgi:hypothetical protein
VNAGCSKAIFKPSRALLAASFACTQTAAQQQQKKVVLQSSRSLDFISDHAIERMLQIDLVIMQSSAANRRTQRLYGVQLLLTSFRSMMCGALDALLGAAGACEYSAEVRIQYA